MRVFARDDNSAAQLASAHVRPWQRGAENPDGPSSFSVDSKSGLVINMLFWPRYSACPKTGRLVTVDVVNDGELKLRQKPVAQKIRGNEREVLVMQVTHRQQGADLDIPGNDLVVGRPQENYQGM